MDKAKLRRMLKKPVRQAPFPSKNKKKSNAHKLDLKRKHVEEIFNLSEQNLDFGKNVFDTVRELAKKEDITPADAGALSWYFAKVHQYYSFTSFGRERQLQASKRLQSYIPEPFEGRMMIFKYEPEDKRQVYDMWPCVFTTKRLNDGFIGMNLHYYDLRRRVRLFSWLLLSLSGDIERTNTRLRINQERIKSFPRIWDLAQPIIRRYKYNKIKSRFLLIPPIDWGTALMLPFEYFRNKDRASVYRDTLLKSNSEVYGIS